MVAVYVQPSNWDGPEDQRPIQAITLSIRNSIDGEDQSGAIGFSVDEELRKSQDCQSNRFDHPRCTRLTTQGKSNGQ